MSSDPSVPKMEANETEPDSKSIQKMESPKTRTKGICGRKIWWPKTLDKYLTEACEYLASLVNKYCSYFILISVFLSVIGAHGLRTMTYETDNEVLFVPSRSDGMKHREELEKFFPTNYSAFAPGHESRGRHSLEIIITAKNEGSVLTSTVWDEVDKINEFLTRRLVVLHKKKKIRFVEICAKFNDQCLRNKFLNLKSLMKEIVEMKLKLTYPIMINPNNMEKYPLAMHMGGLSFMNSSDSSLMEILDAKALRLVFVLDSTDEEKRELASAWEDGALQALQENITSNHIVIEALNSKSISKELVLNIHAAIPYMPYAIGLVVAYTVANTFHPQNSGKIKIWMGLIGLLNTAIATAGAWGLLAYCGHPWQAINLASVFLLLGVGLDDTFVMLSAWRHTDDTLPLADRMRECYKEAAVSITITSLTNILSFVVGAVWPGFYCVQIFCLYTGVGIIFVYLYNLTFFGAFLNFFGWCEENNLHGFITCFDKDKVDKVLAQEPDDEYTGPMTLSQYIFEECLPNLLINRFVKCLILIVFGVYLGLSIYWLSHTREGFERRKLARDNSFVVSYFSAEDAHFRLNPYRFQVAILEPLDYSNLTVRESVTNLLREFNSSEFIFSHPDFEENWLSFYENYANEMSNKLNTDKEEFMANENFNIHLIEMLSTGKSDNPLDHNVIFSEDKRQIIASRFFFQSGKISNAIEEMAMVLELRRIASSANFNVVVFNPYFPYLDMFLDVKYSTCSCLLTGTLIMFIIAILLIPNIATSFWVIITIGSIEAGVMGLMYVWNINLDVISMICLIMCIGFSVDFSAHVSYHFMAADEESADERVRSSLTAFGTPIIQGGTSTILAVVVFSVMPSYILQSFVKMLLLVIVLGVVHGLFLLPVLLSSTEFLKSGFCWFIKSKPKSENDDEKSADLDQPS